MTCLTPTFGNMDVAESGQSNKFIHSQAVELVGSGLAQGKAVTEMELTLGSSPDLNQPQNLWGNSPAEALQRGSCTCLQQPAERLKSVWANVPWATRKHLVSAAR